MSSHDSDSNIEDLSPCLVIPCSDSNMEDLSPCLVIPCSDSNTATPLTTRSDVWGYKVSTVPVGPASVY